MSQETFDGLAGAFCMLFGAGLFSLFIWQITSGGQISNEAIRNSGKALRGEE